MGEPTTIPCQECDVRLEADSEMRVDVTDDLEPLVYCTGCWEREFGEDTG